MQDGFPCFWSTFLVHLLVFWSTFSVHLNLRDNHLFFFGISVLFDFVAQVLDMFL